MKDLEKMLMKLKDKKEGDMNPQEMQAKQDVLQELLNMAHEAMGNKVKHGMSEMQKVTVAAKDPQALSEGLKKAQEMVGSGDMEQLEEQAHSDLDQDGEQGEDPEHADKVMVPNEEMKQEMAKDDDEEDDEPSMFAKKPKLDAAPSESPSDEEEKPKRKKLFSMIDDE